MLLAVCIAFLQPRAFHGSPSEPVSEEPESKNIPSLKVGYSAHLLEEPEERGAADDAPELDHLGDFRLSYERIVLPGWLLGRRSERSSAPSPIPRPQALPRSSTHRPSKVAAFAGTPSRRCSSTWVAASCSMQTGSRPSPVTSS